MDNRLVEILVSGGDGQLGQELQYLSKKDNNYSFNFFSKNDLDIRSEEKLEKYFSQIKPKFFINCAAYTQVDLAEKEPNLAFELNAKALKTLSHLCSKHQTVLIHISSDYVYHNDFNRPLKETDKTSPKGVYAKSKLEGEEHIREICKEHIIIRSSWIYSSFGKNFVKTMLRLFHSKEEISVVTDQLGSPTYARDLANLVIKKVLPTLSNAKDFNTLFGVYNYSNEGATNWFEFAVSILKLSGLKCTIKPTTTETFNAAAPRPKNSVLDKSKIKKAFILEDIPHWKDSLAKCMSELNN